MRAHTDDEADYGGRAYLGLTVSVHVAAETSVTVSPLQGQGRAMVRFRGNRYSTDVTVFLPTAQLSQLRDLLTDALAALTDAADAPADLADDAGKGDRPGGVTFPTRSRMGAW